MEKAFDCFLEAANQGHADAQFEVGHAYETGEGPGVDYDKACEWYGRAANSLLKAKKALENLRECRLRKALEEAAKVLKDMVHDKERELPGLPDFLQGESSEKLYDQAMDAEKSGAILKAIVLYAWSAERGSKKALCTILNMGVEGSLYFFDQPNRNQKKGG